MDSWQAVFLAPNVQPETPQQQQENEPAPAYAKPAPVVTAAAPAATEAPAAGPSFNPGALWASPAVASVRAAVAQVPSAASAFASSPLAASLALPLVAAVAGAAVAVLMTRNEGDSSEPGAAAGPEPADDARLSDKLLWRGRRLLAAAGSTADEAGGAPHKALFALLHAAASIAGALGLIALSAAASVATSLLWPARALLGAFRNLWRAR